MSFDTRSLNHDNNHAYVINEVFNKSLCSPTFVLILPDIIHKPQIFHVQYSNKNTMHSMKTFHSMHNSH